MANSLAHIRRVCKCHIVFKLSVIYRLRPGSLPVKVKQAENPVLAGLGIYFQSMAFSHWQQSRYWDWLLQSWEPILAINQLSAAWPRHFPAKGKFLTAFKAAAP